MTIEPFDAAIPVINPSSPILVAEGVTVKGFTLDANGESLIDVQTVESYTIEENTFIDAPGGGI